MLKLRTVLCLGLAAVTLNAQTPDLTRQPTLYVVGYAHLDTEWRWEYPQVIDEYLRKTMEDNFPEPVRKIMERHKLTPFIGTPDDCAKAAVFLASDESRYTTGQNLFAISEGNLIHYVYEKTLLYSGFNFCLYDCTAGAADNSPPA